MGKDLFLYVCSFLCTALHHLYFPKCNAVLVAVPSEPVVGVSELFARLIVAVIAIKVISYPLACFCDPAAWVTAAVFTGVSYLFVMKDIDKKYDSKTPTAPIS